MATLLSFPGQGAQRPGMLHALPGHPAVARTLAEASDVLGHDVLRLDAAERLASTVAVQLCLLVAGVASARHLLDDGTTVDAVAGLSIGAYAAAVVANALAFDDALRLVTLRGKLMEDAYPSGYGMTAILGLEQGPLETIIAAVNGPDSPIYLANYNAETQLVIAGSEAGMARVAELAIAAGARSTQRVAIAVPSHCPLLDDAAASLTRAFSGITLRCPSKRYFSASAARELRVPSRIADDLAHNMAQPVRWHETMLLACACDMRLAVEVPPGDVLTRLGRPLFPGAVALGNTPIDNVRTLIARER
ncbi:MULTISPECIES: malonate decarboxylase subunit epsilon [Cupriavidus]|uniref:Malonyl CoA-acyl carrier protein transacylase n=1 Tax=Cupriavidus metallidurans TaxID=119219 RepID=A0A482J6I0_9BURK|nr:MULTISPECIES: malonate decarboxylase subunit epsilon [Cupriavidus]MWL91925.1 malonate decarboxylase subunit epsilon [Cupriavidus sp. SW-Y-13]QBP14564.1 malonate decarboxylase subunit epsilon [Cupriavidus metallidurans]